MAETGQPAPFRLGAPAYLVAFAGWVVASLLLLGSASDLTGLAISGTGPVGAAHALGLVFFPFAVAAAVWQQRSETHPAAQHRSARQRGFDHHSRRRP
jgi:hypothetical protein